MRWRRRVVVAAAVALGGCSGSQGLPSAPIGSTTIVYSGNVDGEIEPCG